METLYDALGVESDASSEEIRRAYREGAKRHHPDGFEGDEERFRQLTTARDVLLDDDRRKRYDALGHWRYARHYLGDEWPAESPRAQKRSRPRDATTTARKRRSRSARRARGTRNDDRTRSTRRERSPRRSGPADGLIALSTYWPLLVRAGIVLTILLALAFVVAALSF